MITASDERSGKKPAASRPLAPRPLRPVWFAPAPSRGKVWSITPPPKVRRPYVKASPGRRNLTPGHGKLERQTFGP